MKLKYILAKFQAILLILYKKSKGAKSKIFRFYNYICSIYSVAKSDGLGSFFYKLLNKMVSAVKKFKHSVKSDGFKIAIIRSANFLLYGKGVLDKRSIISGRIDYNNWIFNAEKIDIEIYKREIYKFKYKPKISIITPVYNVESRWLNECIKSVVDQLYENWELCLYDDASTRKETLECLDHWENIDPRIKIVYGKENRNISGASNEAIKMSTGEFIALLDNDDELSADALFEVVKLLNENVEVDLIYTDECKKSPTNDYIDFIFKPDWSPEYLLNDMYTGHLSVYRKSIVEKAGLFRSQYDFSQDYDLILRVSEITQKIYHIEKVLYFWRQIDGSAAAGGKNYARETNLAALGDAMKRRGVNAEVQELPLANRAKISFDFSEKISIIIPSDSYLNIEKSIKSILNKTSYENFEIVVVTNSKLIKELEPLVDNFPIKVIFSSYDKKYNFSDKCNCGAAVATGEIFVFLNDDVFPIDNDWIENLIEFLYFDSKIGAVSPRLLSEDGSIQYAGMTTNANPFCGTFLNGKNKDSYLAERVRNTSIISGACFAIRKKVFIGINGFDAVNTPAGHSDLDLSFKLREQGFRCVYTPYATLCHVGNHSWHIEKDKADIFVLSRWGKYISKDPYYTKSLRAALEGYMPDQFGIYSGQSEFKAYSFDALIVLHELTITGAPIVALNAAKAILNEGGYPVIFSYSDGPLRAEFEKINVPVVINNLAEKDEFSFKYFAKNFDVVIVNTVVAYMAVHLMQDIVPTIWYIHEAKNIRNFFIPNFSTRKPSLDFVLRNTKATVYAASEYSKDAVSEYVDAVKILNLGFDDLYDGEEMQIDGKIQFSMVGTVEERKAQDVFIEAIMTMPIEYRQKAIFNIIGNDKAFNVFATKLKIKTKGIENIKWHGLIEDQIIKKEIFVNTNVFVIISREEPTSIVAIEGAMLGRPSVISRNVGAKYIIEDGKTGFVVDTNNVEKLRDILIKIIDNPQSLVPLGREARKKYLATSTFDLFQLSLLKAIKERMNS